MAGAPAAAVAPANRSVAIIRRASMAVSRARGRERRNGIQMTGENNAPSPPRLNRESGNHHGRARAARPPSRSPQNRLVGGEAIEQPIAPGAAQIALAAATVRPARGMRGIPRPRRRIVAQPLAVDVTNHRGALGAAGPVAAGSIVTGRERAAFRRRAGQDIMTIRRKANAGNDLAALAQRRIKAELVTVTVQIVHTRRNDLALEILPR